MKNLFGILNKQYIKLLDFKRVSDSKSFKNNILLLKLLCKLYFQMKM